MNEADKQGFFADEKTLDMEKYLIFDYYFESTIDPEEAAAHLCQEQSTAQWKRVGVDEDLRDQFGAKVIELKVERELDRPSLALPIEKDKPAYACQVKIAHPHGNFGPKLPNILTAACGEGAFYSPGIAAIKLYDIEFPASFLDHFEGPKFGVEGLRNILGVHDRPLFFGVIKPNIGLPPEPFAELAYQSWLGGVDIAKDDEMLSDVEWSPFEKRAQLLGRARLKSEAETGVTKIYLANITDEVASCIFQEFFASALSFPRAAEIPQTEIPARAAVVLRTKSRRVILRSSLDFIGCILLLSVSQRSTRPSIPYDAVG